MASFKENVLALTRTQEGELKSFTIAVLKAVQESAREHDGKKFRLLEGVVHVDEEGRYIFTPCEPLEKLLANPAYSVLFKQEESRFIQLITLALQEV